MFYVPDLWWEIAVLLDRDSLRNLCEAWIWFSEVVMPVNSPIWKTLVLRHLNITDPGNVDFNWRQLYTSDLYDTHAVGTHVYNNTVNHRHIDWFRMGGLYLQSQDVYVTARTFTQQEIAQEIAANGESVVRIDRIKTGVWLLEIHMAHCDCWNRCGELETRIVLRHMDLPSIEGVQDQQPEFVTHDLQYNMVSRSGIILDEARVHDASIAGLFDVNEWSELPNGFVLYKLTPHGAGCSTDLQVFEGVHYTVDFDVMRNGDGEAVLILITNLVVHWPGGDDSESENEE